MIMVDSKSVNKVLIKLMNMLTAVVVAQETTTCILLPGFPHKQKKKNQNYMSVVRKSKSIGW